MSEKKAAANSMWGGHYTLGPAEAFAAINPSIAIDQRLYAEDIQGSLAHAAMLAKVGILSADEQQEIARGLAQVKAEIEAGTLKFSAALEDIHMNIESRLKDIIGAPAGKLHTARSRNDQVATDLRLYARTLCGHLDAALQALQAALLAQAEHTIDTVMPGLTHLQPAQPISFAHHLLAYVEMFGRDRGRIADAAKRLNECPLGAAALAGTTYPIDRAMTAEILGFDHPMRNSLDAVSARDYVVELLAAFAIIATHLSRLAEELVLWTSPLVGFVKLSEAFTSGSSIMPQKRNPDAAELVRGKTGGIVGALVAMLTTLKALPLAYNKDMQEDKRPFFFAGDEILLSLKAMTGMVADLQPQTDAMRAACSRGYLNATDLADWLVQHAGVPFREAHHLTGQLVRLAEQEKCGLEDLSLAQMQAVHPAITADIFAAIALNACVARRTSAGGTAPERVREALTAARKAWL
ncbi:MAG: argininosuccinate lyase [Alphaproteobacteria bacterium]|nr:argininosuccinate lyase [Alphaproteobacteria bacterium]